MLRNCATPKEDRTEYNKTKTRLKDMKSRIIASFAALALLAVTSAFAEDMHTSSKFVGPKANTGTVTHTVVDGKNILTLSDDFKVPGTPDPHWQVVDSKGNTYLLQKLSIKGDKINRRIALPAYIQDVSKVQIWCAFAEIVLGEASFDHPLQLTSR
jgi:hypothetical protein